MDKKQSRLRRARRTRAKIRELGVARLSVHRTSQHIYAQVIDSDGGTVLASASSAQPDLRKSLKSTSDIVAAQAVGKAIAEKAKSAGIEQVAFDRSGFRYHGRIKALAEAAREQGLRI
jgi:large subunit ribosomal protein L18